MRRAILDTGGVLRGFSKPLKKTEKPGSDDVLVPDDCDLAVDGRYAWRGASFVPVAKPTEQAFIGETETMTAIAGGLKAMRDAGIPLPEQSLRWLNWFHKTVDGGSL